MNQFLFSNVHRDRAEAGFSLVELMVAVTLGLMLTAMVVSVFVAGNRSYNEDDRLARMQENGRFAMRVLLEDLAMASFWGTLPGPSATTALAPSCNIPLNATNALVILDQPDTATTAANFDCVDPNKLWDETNAAEDPDVLLVKRVRGENVAAFENGAYLVVTSGAGSIQQLASTDAADPASSYWKFVPHLYYIRNYSVDAADEIPTLVRRSLDSTLAMAEEPLVEGVENFQVEFGVDLNNDGIADQYLESPTAAQMAMVINARVYVLVRSLQEDPAYTDTKSYNLGATVIAARNDGFYRRVYSSNVSLRNLVNFAAFDRSAL